jgi:hypothetical protein
MMLYGAGGQAGLGELADRAERVGVTYGDALDERLARGGIEEEVMQAD